MLEELFDFSFRKFVTPKIAGIVLGILYAFEVLYAAFQIIVASRFGGTAFILTLIEVAIVLPISMILTRIWIEVMISMVRVAEESSRIREILETTKKIDSN